MNYILSSFSVVLIVANVFSQSPQVIETSPLSQTLITAPSAPIVITFDQPLNEATITTNTFRVFARWSGPMDGTTYAITLHGLVQNDVDIIPAAGIRSVFGGNSEDRIQIIEHL